MKTSQFAIPLQAIVVIFLIEVFTLLGGQFYKTINQSNCNFNSFGISFSTVLTSGFIVFFLVTVWWWFQGYQNATPEASPESKNLELQHYQQLGEKLQPNQALLAAIVKDTKTLITNLKSHVINNFSPGQNLAELGKLLGKNTAQELQESEARFRNVFDNSAVGMGLVALDGRWLKVNQSLCEITGYSESELLQTNFQKITHIDDLNTEFNYVNQLLKGETRYYQIEKRYIHKQGHIVWTLLSKSLVRNSQSEPLYFIAQIQDITQPKQAVNAVKLKYEQERLLDIIVQHIRQSLNLKEILQTTVMEIHKFLDCDRVVISRISRQNSSAEVIVESRYPNCQSLLGWKISNNLYQQPSNHKISKDQTSQVINNINQSLLEPAELQLLKNFDVQAQLTIPIWQGKSIWGWLIAHSCQTKRQWQSQEVNLLQRLKNQLEVAIYQSELHHQLQQLNANLERQVQARTLEFQQALNFEATLKRITDKVRDSFDESQILQQAVEELAKVLEVKYCETTLYNLDKTTSTTRYESTNIGGAISQLKGLNAREESTIYQQLLSGQHFAFCNLTPSDEGKHYAILACPIVDDQGVLGNIRLFKPELSSFSGLEIRLVQQVANQCAIALRQSHLYQAAQKQVAELEKLNQLKNDFLSTISHELRTPVSNIKMIAQMLGITLANPEKLCNQSKEINRYLQIIRDESQREMDLINDLLILTQISADTEPLVLNTIQLQALIPHITEIFTETIDRQQQQLKIDIPDSLPALTTDVTFLERIFMELLNNACKYSPSGETITVTAKALKDKLQISISNTGIEIPQVEKERIFDKFYRIPSNDPWKQGGTGLGLALVKKLIEHLGGTIELATNDGEVKTTFLLSFPVVSRPLNNSDFSEVIAS